MGGKEKRVTGKNKENDNRVEVFKSSKMNRPKNYHICYYTLCTRKELYKCIITSLILTFFLETYRKFMKIAFVTTDKILSKRLLYRM